MFRKIMNRFRVFILPAIIFVPLIFSLVTSKSNQTKIQLEGKIYKVLVADNREAWAKGLSGIKKLKGYDGMVFIFPNKQKRVFWNNNTHLNLKLYWLDGEKIIGTSRLPSIENTKEQCLKQFVVLGAKEQCSSAFTVMSPAKVNKVVELVIK